MEKLQRTALIPEGTSVKVDARITITGPKGEVSRVIPPKNIIVSVESNKIIISPKKRNSRKEKTLINTFFSHIKNMIKGVNEEFIYKLKVCSSHFPMKVVLKGNVLEVENFLGEKISRKLKIKENAKVSIEGDIISVTSPDKETAGQIAANIEKLMKRPGFDRRIFMDGIYMTEKAGVPIK